MIPITPFSSQESERAMEVNLEIVRAFVRLREMPGAHRERTAMMELESRIQDHGQQIKPHKFEAKKPCPI
ncbi:MAG: hypothetical protein R6X27_09635 [Candidatus Desulfacyla sp.]